MSEFWKTSISSVRPNEILVRGYPIEELIRTRSFGDAVFLLLTGELPTGDEGRLVEAMLVACCEHSLVSPSVDAVRFVASAGVPLQTAVAAGVSAIGDAHGGAMEPCAVLLAQAVARGETAATLLERLRAEGQRLPGFGHPLHTADPRVGALFARAGEWGLRRAHCQLALELEAQSEQATGRRLPMNVDGAIAALLCDLGVDPRLGRTIFIVSRCAGYAAHAHEQATRERPFKAALYSEITYTGPARRPVPPRPPTLTL